MRGMCCSPGFVRNSAAALLREGSGIARTQLHACILARATPFWTYIVECTEPVTEILRVVEVQRQLT